MAVASFRNGGEATAVTNSNNTAVAGVRFFMRVLETAPPPFRVGLLSVEMDFVASIRLRPLLPLGSATVRLLADLLAHVDGREVMVGNLLAFFVQDEVIAQSVTVGIDTLDTWGVRLEAICSTGTGASCRAILDPVITFDQADFRRHLGRRVLPAGRLLRHRLQPELRGGAGRRAGRRARTRRVGLAAGLDRAPGALAEAHHGALIVDRARSAGPG
ncbi:MAG TPA: hypothetical protein VML54_02650 [Candidatus Limnocylindrales bacterium]|nr:hypothetical protein [Candidatus Limnocylindrales bacterium]